MPNNIDKVLLRACANGQTHIVRDYIDLGFDIHVEKDIAIWIACQEGHTDIVKILIENGINIHADDDYALLQAYKGGYIEIVKLLIENGMDNSPILRDLLCYYDVYNMNIIKYINGLGGISRDLLFRNYLRRFINAIRMNRLDIADFIRTEKNITIYQMQNIINNPYYDNIWNRYVIKYICQNYDCNLLSDTTLVMMFQTTYENMAQILLYVDYKFVNNLTIFYENYIFKRIWRNIHLHMYGKILNFFYTKVQPKLDKPPSAPVPSSLTRESAISWLSTGGRRFAREHWQELKTIWNIDLGPLPEQFVFKPYVRDKIKK